MKDLLKVIIKEEVARAMLGEGKIRDFLKKHSRVLAVGAALGAGAHAGMEHVADRVSQHAIEQGELSAKELQDLNSLKQYAIDNLSLDGESEEGQALERLRNDRSNDRSIAALNNLYSVLSTMEDQSEDVKHFIEACNEYMAKHNRTLG